MDIEQRAKDILAVAIQTQQGRVPPDVAEDVAQQTVLVLLQEGLVSSEDWQSITHNTALSIMSEAVRMHKRNEKTKRALAEKAHGGGVRGRESAKDAVRSLMESVLLEQEKRLLYYTYWVELTDRESSRQLGMPRGTVHWKRAEALTKLRMALMKWGVVRETWRDFYYGCEETT